MKQNPKKETFVYDRTLRDLLQDIPTTFVKLLTGKNAIKMLDSRFPNVEEKEADLIVELEDREIYHIEVQSTDDKNMPQRMLYYALAIQKVHKKFPRQLVIYVGEKDIDIKNSLSFNGNYFSYEVKNIKDIDCKPLIESENIADNIIAILCDINDVLIQYYPLVYNGRWQVQLNQTQKDENFSRAKAFVIVNPYNPTGSIISKQ